jgi:hypothetical protein
MTERKFTRLVHALVNFSLRESSEGSRINLSVTELLRQYRAVHPRRHQLENEQDRISDIDWLFYNYRSILDQEYDNPVEYYGGEEEYDDYSSDEDIEQQQQYQNLYNENYDNYISDEDNESQQPHTIIRFLSEHNQAHQQQGTPQTVNQNELQAIVQDIFGPDEPQPQT